MTQTKKHVLLSVSVSTLTITSALLCTCVPTFPNPVLVCPNSPVAVPKPAAVLVWAVPNNPPDWGAAVFPNKPCSAAERHQTPEILSQTAQFEGEATADAWNIIIQVYLLVFNLCHTGRLSVGERSCVEKPNNSPWCWCWPVPWCWCYQRRSLCSAQWSSDRKAWRGWRLVAVPAVWKVRLWSHQTRRALLKRRQTHAEHQFTCSN